MVTQIDYFAGSIDETTIIIDDDNDSSISSMTSRQVEAPSFPSDRVLWDGIFWLEAFYAVRRSVDWFQLNSIIDGVREEALFRAGIIVHDDI